MHCMLVHHTSPYYCACFLVVGITHGDGSTPVPSELSPLPFLPETPPTSPTPRSLLVDEDQSDSPPSLVNGSSVDMDSSSLGRKTDSEEFGEQSTITTATGSGTPLLTITLPKLRGALISSMSSVAAATCSQLKLPMTRQSMRKQQTSSVDAKLVTRVAVSSQENDALPTPTLTDEGEASKLPSTSPLSPQLSSKPLVTSDCKTNDKPTASTSSLTAGAVVEQLQKEQPNGQQKALVESSTCTEEEEEEDNDDDVIEIGEVESELDISVGGGEGEGEGEGEREEKGTSVSADTLSSDDEWDESLLPPRYTKVPKYFLGSY